MSRPAVRSLPMSAKLSAEAVGMAAAPSPAGLRPWLVRPRVWRPVISLAVLLVGWELIGRFVLTNQLFFVPLSDVIAALLRLAASGELQQHIGASFRAIGYGMALAVVIGITFGIVLGASRTV